MAVGYRVGMFRRACVIASVFVALTLGETVAEAQIAPTGTHYAGRSSDTGYAGPTASGSYATSIALDLPAARAGLPVPVQIVSGTRGFGAAGLGWDVPLSFVNVNASYGHRRPAMTPRTAIAPRVRISVALPGRSVEMIARNDEWVGKDAPDLRLRANGDTWSVFDGNGLTYTFSQDPLIFGSGLWLLDSIKGPGGATVALTYRLAAVNVPGAFEPAMSIDLASVRYNPSPTDATCFKHEVDLLYAIPFGASPQSYSVIGTRVRVRDHRLSAVTISSHASCGDAPQRLRRYRFGYASDADTRQERLITTSSWLGRSFRNWAGDLPGAQGLASPYVEYRVAPAAGTVGAGTLRVVANPQTGEMFYTWTHYGDTGLPAFVQIR